jgi:hypothetical protein
MSGGSGASHGQAVVAGLSALVPCLRNDGRSRTEKLPCRGASTVNIHSGQPNQKEVVDFYSRSVLLKLGSTVLAVKSRASSSIQGRTSRPSIAASVPLTIGAGQWFSLQPIRDGGSTRSPRSAFSCGQCNSETRTTAVSGIIWRKLCTCCSIGRTSRLVTA